MKVKKSPWDSSSLFKTSIPSELSTYIAYAAFGSFTLILLFVILTPDAWLTKIPHAFTRSASLFIIVNFSIKTLPAVILKVEL